jgi:hypothetical protein
LICSVLLSRSLFCWFGKLPILNDSFIGLVVNQTTSQFCIFKNKTQTRYISGSDKMKPFMKNMVDDKKWISISSGSLLPGISFQPKLVLGHCYFSKKYIPIFFFSSFSFAVSTK